MLTVFGQYNSRFNPWVYVCAKVSEQDTYVSGQPPFDGDALASKFKPFIKLPFPYRGCITLSR